MERASSLVNTQKRYCFWCGGGGNLLVYHRSMKLGGWYLIAVSVLCKKEDEIQVLHRKFVRLLKQKSVAKVQRATLSGWYRCLRNWRRGKQTVCLLTTKNLFIQKKLLGDLLLFKWTLGMYTVCFHLQMEMSNQHVCNTICNASSPWCCKNIPSKLFRLGCFTCLTF